MKHVKEPSVSRYQNSPRETRTIPNNFLKGLALISIGPTLMANFLPQIQNFSPQLSEVLAQEGLDEAGVLIISSLILGVTAVFVGIMRGSMDIRTTINFYVFMSLLMIAYFLLDPVNFFDQPDFVFFSFLKSVVPLTVVANGILVFAYFFHVYTASDACEKMKQTGNSFFALLGVLISSVSIMGDGLDTANRIFVFSSQAALIQDTHTVVLILNIILSLTFLVTNLEEAWPPSFS
jgi:hypothetical protein